MPHLLPLGTTLEGLEKRQRWGWGRTTLGIAPESVWDFLKQIQ